MSLLGSSPEGTCLSAAAQAPPNTQRYVQQMTSTKATAIRETLRILAIPNGVFFDTDISKRMTHNVYSILREF